MFLQESVDEKPVKSTGCSYYYTWIIPSPWYNSSGGQVVIFFIRVYVANSIYKFSNYDEKRINTDIVIDDMVRIRNRAYNKILMKLKFETSEGSTYYGKYICDPLYYETYLKSKLYRKINIDISVWHSRNNKKYYIDVRDAMKRIAGVEGENYRKDLLKEQVTDIDFVQVIMLILLLIDILLIIINIVDSNMDRVFLLICFFVIISFLIYWKAKKG